MLVCARRHDWTHFDFWLSPCNLVSTKFVSKLQFEWTIIDSILLSIFSILAVGILSGFPALKAEKLLVESLRSE